MEGREGKKRKIKRAFAKTRVDNLRKKLCMDKKIGNRQGEVSSQLLFNKTQNISLVVE